jgi:Na+/phosphate symporter
MCNPEQMKDKTWTPAGFVLGGLLPGGETAVLTLLVSVAIAVVGIIVVFFVLSLVGLDKSIAGTAATAIIGGIPYLRDTLDKEGLLRARRTRRAVLSFDGFGLSPQKLILNGTLILFAAMNLSAALVGVARAGSALDFKTIALVATIVVYPTIFLVGRWVGAGAYPKGSLRYF